MERIAWRDEHEADAFARTERHDGRSAGKDVVDGSSGPDELWDRAETSEEVWAALGRLTPEQRAATVARYFLDLGESEMTDVLGCPRSTVKWRLHAARNRLRVLLRPATLE